MTESIEDRIRKMMVTRLFMRIPPEDIKENESLIDSYGIDSISLLELVVGIEEEFGLVIGDDEFDVKHFETVGALSAFIRAKQG